MNDFQQQTLMHALSRDFRKRDLLQHFAFLYKAKLNYINNSNKQPPNKTPPNLIYNKYDTPREINKINTPRETNHINTPRENNKIYISPRETPNQQVNEYKNLKNNQQYTLIIPNKNKEIIETNNISFDRYKKSLEEHRVRKNIDEKPTIQNDAKTIENIKKELKELTKNKIDKKIKITEKKVENVPEKKVENIPEKKVDNVTEIIKKEPSPSFSNYIQSFLIQEKLKKLVENKNITIVGPANYLVHLNQGETIDKSDIVIRFNNSIIPNQNFYRNVGTKTDIWIYNFKDESILDKLPNKMPKLLFCPYPKKMIEDYQINKNMPDCPIEFIDPNFYDQLRLAIGFNPNSTLLTILILLRQNIKSLYVTGFSFLYDGYYDNKKKNDLLVNGALVPLKNERNNLMSILKKLYNANEKLIFDNTIVNLIYPNFIKVISNLFNNENQQKLFSTLNYKLFIPQFQSKYNSPNINTKIYVHFGDSEVDFDIIDKMNLIVHSLKPKSFENEVYIKNEECDYDDLELLLSVKNKGIVYFSNNQWDAIDNMIPKKNRDYILRHHCYVNGNIYGSFLSLIKNDFDINEDNKNLNMLYMLFSLIYFGQKVIYVSKENIVKNNIKEIINVMHKLNLIKYIK